MPFATLLDAIERSLWVMKRTDIAPHAVMNDLTYTPITQNGQTIRAYIHSVQIQPQIYVGYEPTNTTGWYFWLIDTKTKLASRFSQ
jgi:hypothetical protein